MDFIWVHEAATVLESTLAHSLNIIGTKTLVVEMGVGMRINHDCCEQLIEGILNLLSSMQMWHDNIERKVNTPVLSVGDSVSFINAEKSGIFITDSHVNSNVKKGQRIGMIVSSLTGEILEDVIAPVDGLMFTLRAYPVVYEGSLLARIHVFKENV